MRFAVDHDAAFEAGAHTAHRASGLAGDRDAEDGFVDTEKSGGDGRTFSHGDLLIVDGKCDQFSTVFLEGL